MVLSANDVLAMAQNVNLTQPLKGAGVVQLEEVELINDQFNANDIVDRTVADIVEQGVAVIDGVSLTVESNIEEAIGVNGLDGAAAILTDSGIVLIESPAVGIIAPAEYVNLNNSRVVNNEINNSNGIQDNIDEMKKNIEVANESNDKVESSCSDDSYFSNDQESITDKETVVEDHDCFVINDIVGKGKGMFATRTIYPGEILLREIPLIIINAATFNDMVTCERYLDKLIDKFSMVDRIKFLSCSYGGNENSYLGRFYTNDMDWDGDFCLCPTMARANHSCRPNADFYTCIKQDYNFLLAIR